MGWVIEQQFSVCEKNYYVNLNVCIFRRNLAKSRMKTPTLFQPDSYGMTSWKGLLL